MRYPRAVPVVIFALILAVTALSVFSIERGEREREQAEMVRLSESVTASLILNGATNASYLRAGAALFRADHALSQETFAAFVDELRLNVGYNGAEGIGWAPFVPAARVPAFEAELRAVGAMNARIRPSLEEAPRFRLVPVQYLQPDAPRNRRAVGFDMYSERVRRDAMNEAMQKIDPVASGKVRLVQGGAGFVVYMPVFQGNDFARIKGFIYSPFNADEFLKLSLEADERIRRGMGVALYDGAVRPGNLLTAIQPDEETGETYQKRFRIADHPFTLVVESTNGGALSTLSHITLLFGLAVASLLMLVARLQTKQAIEDERSLNWLHEQNSIRNSLTRELNHRVKNTLANVLSIIALTRRRATDIQDFADGLDGRIRALSATHDLLTQSEWNTTPVAAVVDAELAPYAKGGDVTIERTGPDVELAPNDALSLGMALHELATNAAKYGALSRPGGCVTIRWELDNETLARLHWAEQGGPPVSAERSRGFGTDLIEKIVAHELRHPVDLKFAASGVTCTLVIPVRRRGAFQMRA